MKRGCKRAQISVFIIVAIVVVAVIGIVVYVSQAGSVDKEFFSSSSIKPQVDNIKDSVLNCMKITSEDSLEVIGIQGGYYEEPKDFFDLGWAFIPYYYNEGSFSLPSKRTIETELGKSVNDNLKYCLDELSFEGFEVSYSEPRTKASIKENEIEFNINFPVTIEKENKRITFEAKDFPVSVSSKLFGMYEIAEYITNGHKEDPDMICISCVTDMSEERGLFVDMLDFGDEVTTLIVISTGDSGFYPLTFEFLNKYPVKSGSTPIAPSE